MSTSRPTSRERSISEPSFQVLSSNFTRQRLRKTGIEYERGKDKLAHWLGAWGHGEVCALLQYLVTRCPLSQMEYLWTVMESVPHRDFLYSAVADTAPPEITESRVLLKQLEEGLYRPLSTPISRSITVQLKKSRRKENMRLHRVRSVPAYASYLSAQDSIFNDLHLFEPGYDQTESQLLLLRSIPEGATVSKLPISHCGPRKRPVPPTPIPRSFCSPYGPTQSPWLQDRREATACTPPTDKSRLTSLTTFSRIDSPVSTRILTPMRRHMTAPAEKTYNSHQLHITPKGKTMSPQRNHIVVPGAKPEISNSSEALTEKPGLTSKEALTAKPSPGPGLVSIHVTNSKIEPELKPASRQPARPPGNTEPQKLGFETEITTSVGTMKPSGGFETRPITEMDTRPTTGMETRPTTGFETWPTTGLETRPTTGMETRPTTGLTFLGESYAPALCAEMQEFLQWFSDLRDWQQQEIIQMVVWNLDRKELYFLAALVESRRYRDFITQLPDTLVTELLSYLPAKFIIKNCFIVSSGWYYRCSHESVWKVKLSQAKLGLEASEYTSMKELYIDDLKLKKNWMRGKTKHTLLTEHEGRVLCVALRKNLLASGGEDKTVRLWDLATHQCLSVFRGHSGSVWCVTFYATHFLISSSADGTIRIWNTRKGDKDRTLAFHHGTVWSIQQKKEILVSGGQDKLVCIWNIRRCELVKVLQGHKGAVFAVQLDDATTRVFSGSRDNTVKEWQIESGECTRTIKVDKQYPVWSLHWNQGYLASSCGRRIIIWNTDTWKVLLNFSGHEKRVTCVQFYAKGHHAKSSGLLLSCSIDGSVKYWDTTRLKQKVIGLRSVPVNCAAFNDTYVVAGTNYNSIKLWSFHPHHKKQSSI